MMSSFEHGRFTGVPRTLRSSRGPSMLRGLVNLNGAGISNSGRATRKSCVALDRSERCSISPAWRRPIPKPAGTVWFIDNGKLSDEPLGTFEAYQEGWLEKREQQHGSGAIECMQCRRPLDLASLVAWSCSSCGTSQVERVTSGAEISFAQWLALAERVVDSLLASGGVELVSRHSRTAVIELLADAISHCVGWEQVAPIVIDTLVDIDAVAEVYADENDVRTVLDAFQRRKT